MISSARTKHRYISTRKMRLVTLVSCQKNQWSAERAWEGLHTAQLTGGWGSSGAASDPRQLAPSSFILCARNGSGWKGQFEGVKRRGSFLWDFSGGLVPNAIYRVREIAF